MNKKEFVSLTKLVYKDVETNMKDELDRIRREAYELEEEIVKRTKEYLMSAWPNNLPEVQEVRPVVGIRYDPVRVDAELRLKVSIPRDERLEKFEKLKQRISKLYDLRWKWRQVWGVWKLKAIKNRTYSQEPFPKEFWEFVSNDLKTLLTLEGQE